MPSGSAATTEYYLSSTRSSRGSGARASSLRTCTRTSSRTSLSWAKRSQGDSIRSPPSSALANVLGVFNPGDHGSTFGGNPLACAIARVALDVIVEEKLIERSALMGRHFLERLQAIRAPIVREVRGRGLWIGIELSQPARPICATLKDEGLLCKDAHNRVIRLATATRYLTARRSTSQSNESTASFGPPRDRYRQHLDRLTHDSGNGCERPRPHPPPSSADRPSRGVAVYSASYFPPHRQNRTRRRRDHSAGDTAKHKLREAGASVGAQHDEIAPFGASRADDLLRGHALQEQPSRANALFLCLLDQSTQLASRPGLSARLNSIPGRRCDVLLESQAHQGCDHVHHD